MTMFSSPWFGSAGEAYTIDQSCRFVSADSAYLRRTPAGNGDLQTWTLSFWMKRGKTGGAYVPVVATGASGNYEALDLRSDKFLMRHNNTDRSNAATNVNTNDWAHVVWRVNTPGSSGDRNRLYVNGTEVSYTGSDPSLNANSTAWNTSSYANDIGTDTSTYFDGYLAEMIFLDGTSSGPGEFGETVDSVWVPKEFSGSYGTNGFYLDFADSYDLGKDASGANTELDHSGYTATAPTGGTANNAKDGDGATVVTTSSTPSTNNVLVKYDCGSAQTVAAVKVGGYIQANSSGVGYRIEYSTDDSSWTTWDAAVNVSPGNVAATRYTSDTETSARYWRLLANQNHDAAVSIGEFSLMTAAGNNFTSSGLSSGDQMKDSPTNNFSTFNPTAVPTPPISSWTQANLGLSGGFSSSVYAGMSALVIPTDKKIYYEIVCPGSTGAYWGWGACTYGATPGSSNVGSSESVTAYNRSKYVNGTETDYYITALAAGEIGMCAIDGATRKVWFGQDGSWVGDPAAGTDEAGIIDNDSSKDLHVAVCCSSETITNFGADSSFAGNETRQNNADGNGFGDFYYTPPSGFLALCTGNGATL